jgi:hypothetical protein
MYHRRRYVDSPVELSEISMGSGAHGAMVWMEVSGGPRELRIFDKETGFVSQDEFRKLQARRAERRRAEYPNGRKKQRGRVRSFPL